eukprot:4226854-Pyramimonas_sp.AAC.1
MPRLTAESRGAPPTVPRPRRAALATAGCEASAAAFLTAIAQPRSPSMTTCNLMAPSRRSSTTVEAVPWHDKV